MKVKNVFTLFISLMILTGFMTSVFAQPKMEMTTEIPASITISDKVETSIGSLEFFDGVPKEATVAKLYDFIDRGRAVEAFLEIARQHVRSGLFQGALLLKGLKPATLIAGFVFPPTFSDFLFLRSGRFVSGYWPTRTIPSCQRTCYATPAGSGSPRRPS